MCTHFGSVTGVLSMYPAHLRICSNPTDLSLWSMTTALVHGTEVLITAAVERPTTCRAAANLVKVTGQLRQQLL